eukprot:PhM_4_TR10615/c0_g1_i1/m.79632
MSIVRRATKVGTSEAYRKHFLHTVGSKSDRTSQVMGTELNIFNFLDNQRTVFVQDNPAASGLCSTLLSALEKMNISKLTPTQAAVLPAFHSGRTVLAQAETGSGKSFAVALGAANRVLRGTISYRMHTLIVVPTEQLALQYERWIRFFGGHASHLLALLTESVPVEQQMSRLQALQPHILIATPQRIMDISERSKSVFGKKLRQMVDTLIVDEVDVVLKMRPDLIDRLYRRQKLEVPAQLVAISASMDGETMRLMNTWTNHDDQVMRITTSHMEHAIPECLDFFFYCPRTVHPHVTLKKLLAHGAATKGNAFKAMVFTPHVSKLVADLRLAQLPGIVQPLAMVEGTDKNRLSRYDKVVTRGERSLSLTSAPMAHHLHTRGNHIHSFDENAVSKLSLGNETNVGVCDFASGRGLHVPDLTDVFIVGDVPTPGEFVHLAGRTGRMGTDGDVSLIYTPYEARKVNHICDVYEIPFRLSE